MTTRALPIADGDLLDQDRLRELQSQHWVATSDRGYEVFSYAEGFQVLEHPKLLKGPSFVYRIDQLGLEGDAGRYFRMVLPATEGEYRRKLRAPIGALFRPSQVAKLRDAVRGIVRDLVAEIDAESPIDLMEQLCWVLPAQTYCHLVSMPFDLAPTVRRIGDQVAGTLLRVDHDRVGEMEAAILEAVDLVREHLDARRANLGDDFSSAMIRQQMDGMLTEEELLVEALSVINASVDNTAHQMGNVFGAMLTDRTRWEAYLADRSLAASMIEETIRMYPRFGTIFRLASEDVTVADQTFPEGSWIFVSVRAAQRDPARFERPDEFDWTRSPARQVMFGAGTYNCLGQNLARLEIEEALAAVADRFPDISLSAPWEQTIHDAVSETSRLIARA